MRYLSVCAGIEAATVAWHHMGWEAAGFSEIEKFPSQVLDHHYPNVPKLGDMTRYKEWDIGTIDLLVGGTPCQSFSVAGLRKGMADPRGNLALVYCGILDHFRPKWFVWENVPGVLSSNGGRDFGSFLGALAELGYGFAYRVLDAQWFGVAQRRRRVFVVGYLGDWRRAAAVLFERQSLRRDLAPSREKREVAPTLTKEGTGVSRTGHNEDGWYIPSVSATLTRGCAQRFDYESETMLPVALAENTIGRQPQNGGNGDGFTVGGPMYTLNATGVHGVAHTPVLMDQGGSVMSVLEDGTVGTLRRETHGHEPAVLHAVGDLAGTLRANPGSGFRSDGSPVEGVAIHNMAVRRLTPTECERLQGFPDGYTDIQPGGKQTPDGPRYKALGNSMAVPVMKWIGERIDTISAND